MPLPAARPASLDASYVPRLIKLMARSQVWFYRRTNGRIGYHWRVGAGLRHPVPTLLLDHRGRRTGTRFTTPLLFLGHGADLVVVASQGGLPKNPQWLHNLKASPDTTVQVKGRRLDVRARVVNASERAELWPKLVELYADFATYQGWTEREIPVVILSPREASG